MTTSSLFGGKRGLVRYAFLLASTLFCAGCRQDPHALAEKHYAKAQTFLHENKADAAVIELSRAVQLSPELAKAHHDLAKVYLQRGYGPDSVRELFLAIRYNGEDHEAYTMLAELLLRGREFHKAKEMAARMVEKWPDDRVAKLILAESMLGVGAPEDARELVAQVVKDDSQNARARFDLARLQVHDKKWAEAEKNLRVSWDLDPKGLRTPLALSQLLESRGNSQDAEIVLKRTADSHSGNVEPLYALAGFYLRHRQLNQAEQCFRQIQSIDFANPKDRGALAVFYAITGRAEDAEKEFQRILASNPDDGLNWRRLAETEISLNKRDEARQIINDLVKKDSKDWEALLLSARLEVDDGKPDQALGELDQVKKLEPGSPMVHFQMARAYLLKGRLELAKGALTEALERAPDFLPARLTLGELELKSGQTELAIQTLRQAAAQKPSSVSPNLLLSEAYAIEGEFDLAEENLNHLLDQKNSPASQAMLLQTLAWVKLRQGRYAEATQLATRSLNMGLLTREGLQVLGLSYLGRKQSQQGLQAVEGFLHKKDRWAAGQQVLGEVALEANNFNVAEKAFLNELEVDPKSTSAIYGLGEVYLRRGQRDLARQTFERFASAEPKNGLVHVELGHLAELNQDWRRAVSEYEKAVELDSSLAVAKNNLAWLYADHDGSITVALRLAQEARSALPQDPHVADTLGWILVKFGSAASAVPYLKECAEKIPTNAVYHYHLGMAYFKEGRPKEAKKELEKALHLQSSFDGSAEAKETLDVVSKTSN